MNIFIFILIQIYQYQYSNTNRNRFPNNNIFFLQYLLFQKLFLHRNKGHVFLVRLTIAPSETQTVRDRASVLVDCCAALAIAILSRRSPLATRSPGCWKFRALSEGDFVFLFQSELDAPYHWQGAYAYTATTSATPTRVLTWLNPSDSSMST